MVFLEFESYSVYLSRTRFVGYVPLASNRISRNNSCRATISVTDKNNHNSYNSVQVIQEMEKKVDS